MTILQTNDYSVVDKLPVRRNRLKTKFSRLRLLDNHQVIVLPLEMKVNNPIRCQINFLTPTGKSL